MKLEEIFEKYCEKEKLKSKHIGLPNQQEALYEEALQENNNTSFDMVATEHYNKPSTPDQFAEEHSNHPIRDGPTDNEIFLQVFPTLLYRTKENLKRKSTSDVMKSSALLAAIPTRAVQQSSVPANPYEYKECQNRFPTTSALVHHLQPTKPHPTCLICSKTFQNSWSLNHHVQIVHLKIKPYCCTVCNKKFGENGTLKRHMLTHTDEKSFSCNFCPRSFRFRSALIRHKRTHTNEKPFCCTLCNKKCTAASNLREHIIRMHTRKFPYNCPICLKGLMTPSALRKHQDRMHQKSADDPE